MIILSYNTFEMSQPRLHRISNARNNRVILKPHYVPQFSSERNNQFILKYNTTHLSREKGSFLL